MAEIGFGNLYDLNKQLMEKENVLTTEELSAKIAEIKTHFFAPKFLAGNKYFMLLCHEDRNYTIFNLSQMAAPTNAAEALLECLVNRGQVLSIEQQPDEAYEIWIKNIYDENQVLCYYLFPYDEAVIEC